MVVARLDLVFTPPCLAGLAPVSLAEVCCDMVEAGELSSCACELGGLCARDGRPKLGAPAADRAGRKLSFSHDGLALRNLHLKLFTWWASIVPMAAASLMLLSGPSVFRASLNLAATSPSPHLALFVDVPYCASSAASLAAHTHLSCASHG